MCVAASEHVVPGVDVSKAEKNNNRHKDLSDKGQIEIARRLGQSISKTAAVLG